MSGISSIELAAKMNLWMEENNTDVWPSLEQLGLTTEKSEETIGPISETETIEDSYMANFNVDGEYEVSEFAEEEFNLDDLDLSQGQEPEFSLDDDVLTVEEKKSGQNLSFAKLTQTLIYQHNDIKNELQNLYGKLRDAKTHY